MDEVAWWSGRWEVDFLWIALVLGVVGVVVVVHLARRLTAPGQRRA